MQSTISRPGDAGAATPSTAARSRVVGWIAALVVHLVLFAYGMSENELLAATAVASLGLLVAFWYAAERKSLIGLAPLIGFLFGHVLVFDYANFGYVELSTRSTGEYPELTGWMGAVIVWSALFSGLCCDVLVGKEAAPKRTGLVTAWQTMVMGTLVFLGMAFLYVVTGAFNGRYETVEPTGLMYFFYGVFTLSYVFFFLLGVGMKGSLGAPRNIAIVAFVLGVAFLQGLSGGREYSVMMCAFLLLGAAFGSLNKTALVGLGTFFASASMLFLVMVGAARGTEFGKESLEGRARGVGNAAQEISADSEDSQQPTAMLLERLFEQSAQVIIDQTVHTGHFAGFEGADALAYMFIPRFIAPNKPVIDEGNVILERDFGFHLGETRIPLTLIGDAYRRGGGVWVFVTGLLAGFFLRLLARAILVLTGRDFGVISLAICTTICFRAYTESVFGLISLFAYTCMKQVVLVVVFAAAARTLVAITEAPARVLR